MELLTFNYQNGNTPWPQSVGYCKVILGDAPRFKSCLCNILQQGIATDSTHEGLPVIVPVSHKRET